MRIVIVSAGCLAVAAGFFVWAEFSTSRAFADASPKTVFVYDGNAGGYEANCTGWIWSEMGFLDKNGKSATDGTKVGDKIEVGTEARGTVLSAADGHANGYSNADGTKEAYDLSRGATLHEAYKRLKNAGDRLVICKHGEAHSHEVPAEGGPKTEFHYGGSLHLDGGHDYTGFKGEGTKGGGTNVNRKGERPAVQGEPYALPAPPSGPGTIKATLYVCWGGDVPGQGEKSIKQSLEDVLGPDSVTAYHGTVEAHLGYNIDTGNASEEEGKQLADKAEAALKAAAKANIHREDILDWLETLPFRDQYKAANDALGPDLKGKVTVQLVYPEPAPKEPQKMRLVEEAFARSARAETAAAYFTFPITPGSDCPLFVVGGGLRLAYGKQATLDLRPGSIKQPGVDVLLLERAATTLASGPGTLESTVLEVAKAVDGNPELRTKLLHRARLTLRYVDSEATPRLYQLRGGGWVRVGTHIVVDRANKTVSGDISTLGTFAAFTTASAKPVCAGTASGSGTSLQIAFSCHKKTTRYAIWMPKGIVITSFKAVGRAGLGLIKGLAVLAVIPESPLPAGQPITVALTTDKQILAGTELRITTSSANGKSYDNSQVQVRSVAYQCVGSQTLLFDNWNTAVIQSGATPPSFSTGGKPYCLAQIATYHWNNGQGQAPGTIGLFGNGTTLGPWKAVGAPGQGGVLNAAWIAMPSHTEQPLIIDGSYTCRDSDPSTWSSNSVSGGQGFCRVWVQAVQKTAR